MSLRPPAEGWEAQLRAIAQAFDYPPTPPIAATTRTDLRRRRPERTRNWWRPALAVLLVMLLIGLWSVPQVRAGFRAILRIGAVQIELPTPTPRAPGAPSPTVPSITFTPQGATERPSPTADESLLRLAGETTLADARRRVPFEIRLPTYPASGGAPDRVFVQNLDGPAVVLVWLEPGHPDQVRLSLHILSSQLLFKKSVTSRPTATTVKGRFAVWINGPHLLEMRDASGTTHTEMGRLVQGNTLIWMDGTITYRLETHQSLSDAVHTAESLR